MTESKPQAITAIVTLETTPETQDEACETTRSYLTGFISKQPGFISGRLHKSLCGTKVINYHQWESMDDFMAFGKNAKDRPELPILMNFQPKAVFCVIEEEI